MQSRPLTLCIINYQGATHLPAALDAVARCGTTFAEILIVDNASTDGSPEWLRLHHPQVRIVALDRNRGPAGARNAGLAAARNDLVLFQDNDIRLERDCPAIGDDKSGRDLPLLDSRRIDTR